MPLLSLVVVVVVVWPEEASKADARGGVAMMLRLTPWKGALGW